jgi:C-terminal processing protease CtpA/Prc
MKMPFVGVIVLALACTVSSGQKPSQETPDPQITSAFIHTTVTSLKSLLQEKYFDTSAISRMETSLTAAEQNGTYATTHNLDELSAKLNETLSDASHDKHIFVSVTGQHGATSRGPALSRSERARMENYGLKCAEILDGNIGYLDITAFYHADEGAQTLKTAMNFVSHTDALILDLRKNAGGSPDTAIQLLSYFFKPNTPLLSIIPRFGEPTVYVTQAAGVSYRDEDRPLYVLVSGSTWSAGESVPFILQERHRATIIGETTAGAANPAGPWPINSYLSINIPFGHIKTAVKGTNWEGTGVTPDIAAPPNKAFVIAYCNALKRLIDSTADPARKQSLEHTLAAAKAEAPNP